MILLYVLIATFIAWIWVDYYRLIDVYHKNKLIYIILTFVLGCGSTFLVIGLHNYFPELFNFFLEDTLLDTYLYYTINVGFIEELAKLIPFLVMYGLFKKEFKEPIDYIAFISVSALGFSAVENVMYFTEYGPTIINGRAILSSVGHMFDTALIAYGFVLYRFHPRHNSIWYLPLFFLLAVLSHGFYDFWLTIDGGWLITVLYFFITISWFAIILNNALNNSTFFNYKDVVYPGKVAIRLLKYYGIVFSAEFILVSIEYSVTTAFYDLLAAMYISGFIIGITCIRLSRFKLIKDRWHPFKVEFPFAVTIGDPLGMKATYFRLRIRGDGHDEATIAPFYQEWSYVYPVSKRRTFIGTPKLAFIDEIGFLKNDEVFYHMKIYETDENSSFESVIIKPKNTGETNVSDNYPIIAMYSYPETIAWNNHKNDAKKFKYREWGYLKLAMEG